MDKTYRVVIHEIDNETHEEKEVLNDEYTGLTLYGDQGDRFSEVMMHENIMGLASKLAQGHKSKIAIKLVNVFEATQKTSFEDMEDKLLDLIGGISDECL